MKTPNYTVHCKQNVHSINFAALIVIAGTQEPARERERERRNGCRVHAKT